MKLTILGSGTLLSGLFRSMAAYVFEKNGRLALLDCGPGTLMRLNQAGIDPVALDVIVLTHYHPDHVSDLFALLLKRYLLDAASISRLILVGPQNFGEWFTDHAAWQGTWLKKALPQVLDLPPGRTWHEHFNITSFPTHHTAESMAFRFGDDLFYSGDTDFDPELVLFASGCHTGLLECSHSDEQKSEGHLSVSEAARFAQEATFSRLIVTHFYPDNEQSDLTEKLAACFKGQIIIAQDLSVYEW